MFKKKKNKQISDSSITINYVLIKEICAMIKAHQSLKNIN
jgi:hypothetical protein